MTARSTKDLILDAAERHFAEHGYDATSLRGVTGEAGVNLAAVNYHFGSKLGLFRAVFERRVSSINQERIARLDALQARGRPPELEEVLEAFVAPALQAAVRRNDPGLALFMQIVGRVNSATGEHVEAIKEVFKEILARFLPAFAATLPQLPQEELLWRLHLLVGSMCACMADPTRLKWMSDGLCDSEDPAEALRNVVAFAAGGLRAPSCAAREGQR